MFDTLAALFCALGIAWVGYTLAVILANMWADQWFARDGSAHHCPACGSPYLLDYPLAFEAHNVSEQSAICADCDATCGYWAHGAHHPGYRENCVIEAMVVLRWFGPLLAVMVASWLI